MQIKFIAICVAAIIYSAQALEAGVIPGFQVNKTHYGNPSTGCESDEQKVTIQGISGDICTPSCTSTPCPTDTPPGTTATPQCALQSPTGDKFCALLCTPGVDDGTCGDATCQPISGIGICTYAEAKSEFEDIVNTVKSSNNLSWESVVPDRFSTLSEAKTLCGTWLKDHPNYTELDLPLSDLAPLPADQVPDSFDARTAFPKCTVISKVRDQSSCGSCWAFGSTEAFEDRRCVSTGEDVVFSTMDTAGCCKGLLCGFSMGCNGGQPSAALAWMSQTGVVTGDDYTTIGSGSSCKPYEFAPCAHHVPASAKYPACPSKEYSTTCEKSCTESGYSTSYSQDKAKGSKAVRVTSVAQMQTELMTNGPLAVAFQVYSDFPTYKSGVYKHTTGSLLGGHAVEMVGWGTENGEDYWLIKNSWNDQWGDEGFFKISRGNNECGIEDDVTGVNF